MKEFNFTKYEDAIKIYREKNLMQALYDEGEIIMDQVLVCLHGDDHRKRRKVENKVFSRETFRLYETDIYPVTLDQTIQPFLKKGKMDLVDFGFRVLLNLTADFSGVDRPEKSPEETETLIKLLNGWQNKKKLQKFCTLTKHLLLIINFGKNTIQERQAYLAVLLIAKANHQFIDLLIH